MRGQHYIRYDDSVKMPNLVWYEDPHDLSWGLNYATNDAYTGPRAKIRFIDFKIGPATRADFQAFYERRLAEYKQVGHVPRPFGCIGGKSASPGCSGPEFAAIFDKSKLTLPWGTQGIYRNGLMAMDIPDDIFEIMKAEIKPDTRWYCPPPFIVEGRDAPYADYIDGAVDAKPGDPDPLYDARRWAFKATRPHKHGKFLKNWRPMLDPNILRGKKVR